MTEISVLEVALYDEPIGTLTRLLGDQTLFAFHQGYIDDPERLTLSLSFKDQFGGLIKEVRPTRARVPPFFSNLLPEGALRDYLAKKAGVNPNREFFLLRILAAICLVRLGSLRRAGTHSHRKKRASSHRSGFPAEPCSDFRWRVCSSSFPPSWGRPAASRSRPQASAVPGSSSSPP